MKTVWFWLPPIGYMAAIFVVSSLSNPQIGGEMPDYVLHPLEYFLLTLLLIRLFLARPSSLDMNGRGDFTYWQQICLLGVVISIIYGITDEIHQYFVPGRHCSLHDVLSDTAGAIFAYGAASLDYLFLKHYSSWLTFLKRFRMVRSVSYATYWFKEE